MAKKVVLRGAPPYMAQFTALMTILLAFFILMQALSVVQETGFKEGIGDVKNAFGLVGGLGVFDFTFYGKGGSKAPNPESGKMEEAGMHENLVKSGGGTGNSDVESSDNNLGKYFRLKIEGEFERGKSNIPPQMAEYLGKAGMGFALFDYKISIRCYTEEMGSDDKDRLLAILRAAQIMRHLNQRSGVPFDRMSCVGYATPAYFGDMQGKDYREIPKQGNYFYAYMKKIEK
ncbi:MAG: hypothetical protein A2020_02950 [Lentisphaerae bacterium GWF2_45_14]|nr:MAG: hypothetical protein A2020_02950 [Lentisphaerae bacterium GWF2_45_14]